MRMRVNQSVPIRQTVQYQWLMIAQTAHCGAVKIHSRSAQFHSEPPFLILHTHASPLKPHLLFLPILIHYRGHHGGQAGRDGADCRGMSTRWCFLFVVFYHN